MASDEEGPGLPGFSALVWPLALNETYWPEVLSTLALAIGAFLAVAMAHAQAALAKASRPRLLARLEPARHRVAALLADPEETAAVAALGKLLGVAGVLAGLLHWAGGSTLTIVPWALATGLAALLLLEVVPLAMARRRPELVILRTAWLLLPARGLLRPLVRPFLAARHFLLQALGLPAASSGHEELAEEILAAVQEQESPQPLAKDEREWIENIVDLKETTASTIMTPRTDMVGVEISTPVAQTLATAVQEGHSRLPVYEGSLDAIVGIFYVKDILPLVLSGERSLAELQIRELMRKPLFIPETKRIPDLLKELRQLRLHMAIVLDEYGGTAGLVTIEDILEEIVGEIEDEYDSGEEIPVRVIEAGRVVEVDGRAHVWEVNESLPAGLPEDEDYETVGGFVFSVLGRIPQAGEAFTHGGATFQVLEASDRSVEKLRIEVAGEAPARQQAPRNGAAL